MESNSIIAAPQVNDTHVFYQKWQENHVGPPEAFHRFMTTPSVEREEFINSLGDKVALTFNGVTAEVTLKANR